MGSNERWLILRMGSTTDRWSWSTAMVLAAVWATTGCSSPDGLVTATTPPAATTPDSMPTPTVPEAQLSLERIEAGIVRVRVPVGAGIGTDPGTYEERYEDATGIVIDTKGHILTCAHALVSVSGSDLFVTAPGSDVEYRAQIVLKGEDVDLALLKSGLTGSDPLPLALSTDGLAGTQVRLAGFPTFDVYANKSQPMFAEGLVSRTDRRVRGWKTRPYLGRLMEVQAFVERGFSGGPVVSHDGEVVGVIAFKVERQGKWGGYALVVPAETVRAFLPGKITLGLEQ